MRALWLCCTVVCIAVGVVASPVPSGLFEMDGNAVSNGGDDWHLLNGTGTGGKNPDGGPGGSVARAFVAAEATQVCETTDTCAIVSSAPVGVSWPYTPKSGTAGTIPAEGSYEGGN
jgi:hypothetical protein